MSTKEKKLETILYKSTIRSFLKEDSVKLWLEPYTNVVDGSKLNVPKDLIEKYSTKMKVGGEVVENLLEELRTHSVLRFHAQKKFKESAIATLFVTLSCPILALEGSNSNPSTSSNSSSNERFESEFTVEVKYHYTTGHKLKEEISRNCNIPANKLKLISNGKYVSDNDTLANQDLKNMSNFLALCLSPHEERAMLERENEEQMNKTKKAAELLVKDNNYHDNQYELQVTDQMGREVVMPYEERKALTIAMTFHEKGKRALKKKQLSMALLYLLEADQEFSKCTSEILGLVDNYALLCLDIVWCYLLLQQVTALPDAERRLEVCEKSLTKSYGKNMERVNKVRGGSNQEQAVFMRLHLLQGVLAYYKGETEKSKNIFNQAEEELNRLKVDEKAMLTVMEIGYSEVEARMALRFSNNHVSNAIEHILTQRQEKRRVKEEEKEERTRRRMAELLGKTADGNDISHGLYRNLISMGFRKGPALEALRVHNNDLILALEFLQANPELDLPSPKSKRKVNLPEQLASISENAIEMLESMGYSSEVAKATLLHHGSDIQRSIEHLLTSGGHIPADWMQALSLLDTDGTSVSSKNSSTSSTSQKEADIKLIEEEIVQEMEGKESEEYLDLSLEDDANILQEFRAKLASLE